MWPFRTKTERDWEREIREEERKIANAKALAEANRSQEEKLALIKKYDRKLVEEREQLLKEKKEEVKVVEDRLQLILREHDNFTEELTQLQVIVTELSAAGMGVENTLVGLTRKFHFLKTRVDAVKRSADRKELRYQETKERIS